MTDDLREAWVTAVARLAGAWVLLGSPDEARIVLHAVEGQIDDVSSLGSVERGRFFHARGHIAVLSGDVAQAIEAYQAGVLCFREAQADRLTSGEQTNLGSQLLELGAYDRAITVLTDALSAGERIRSPYCVAFARANLGRALRGSMRNQEAYVALSTAVEELHALGDRRLEAATRGVLADLLIDACDYDLADQYIAHARSLVDDLPSSLPPLVAVSARCALERGDLQTAVGQARDALVGLETDATEERHTFIRTVAAQVELAAGNTTRAAEIVARAQEKIMEQAAALSDPGLRDALLTQHRESQLIFQLADQLSNVS